VLAGQTFFVIRCDWVDRVGVGDQNAPCETDTIVAV
jgi:hypothetical protein